jgi:hypothetical protein
MTMHQELDKRVPLLSRKSAQIETTETNLSCATIASVNDGGRGHQGQILDESTFAIDTILNRGTTQLADLWRIVKSVVARAVSSAQAV